jgi:hypothetical protein
MLWKFGRGRGELCFDLGIGFGLCRSLKGNTSTRPCCGDESVGLLRVSYSSIATKAIDAVYDRSRQIISRIF